METKQREDARAKKRQESRPQSRRGGRRVEEEAVE